MVVENCKLLTFNNPLLHRLDNLVSFEVEMRHNDLFESHGRVLNSFVHSIGDVPEFHDVLVSSVVGFGLLLIKIFIAGFIVEYIFIHHQSLDAH